MAWEYVGGASFGPNTSEVTVGSVTVPRVGGLQIKVTGGDGAPFQFGYCLLGFRSTFGYELGIIRVWPRPEFTAYWLGQGMRVTDTNGSLVVRPRTWNLRWVEAGFPLSLSVLADVPSLVYPDAYTPNGYGSPEGQELPLAPVGDLGSLQF